MGTLMITPEVLENFRRITTRVDTRPFVSEIRANEHLWKFDTRRQDRISVQRETNTIALRRPNFCGEFVTSSLAAKFPLLMDYLRRFSRNQNANLQRAMIVRLKPNGRVYPHVDEGAYYRDRDRYHLVLLSPHGSRLTSGRECAIFHEGELWWFNNKFVHSSENNSADSRVHVVFDLLPLPVKARPLMRSAKAAAAKRAGERIETHQARSDRQLIKEGVEQMSERESGDATRPNNGNGGEAHPAEDNGNGVVAHGDGTSANDDLDHSYSFEVKRGDFSLRVQLQFRAGQVRSYKITDNGNGG
jgi:hypothetical protein